MCLGPVNFEHYGAKFKGAIFDFVRLEEDQKRRTLWRAGFELQYGVSGKIQEGRLQREVNGDQLKISWHCPNLASLTNYFIDGMSKLFNTLIL